MKTTADLVLAITEARKTLRNLAAVAAEVSIAGDSEGVRVTSVGIGCAVTKARAALDAASEQLKLAGWEE